MSQTSIIAGVLLVAFVVFITLRGELPAYLAALGLGAGPITPTKSLSSVGGGQIGGLTGSN